ncbi:MAG TPA: pentapeptide repeat-containing protein [Blastocatellia bacterium]|nr:pentapeptide repeat-containing protein [Blastocatellia bacterium]
MANPKHLQILKQGIEKWNEWRLSSRDVRPNLNEANLGGGDLRGISLSGANLSGANLISLL